MTTVINLFGSPSSGKSTLQADLYAKMKKDGYDVEMVREVAKKWALSKNEISAFDQLNIIGEQIKHESDLYGKVEYIITDSPVMLGAFYMNYNHKERFMQNMVQYYMNFAQRKGVEFKNILLNRRGIPYQRNGRFESENEVTNLENSLQEFLDHGDLVCFDLTCHTSDRVEEVFKYLFKREVSGAW